MTDELVAALRHCAAGDREAGGSKCRFVPVVDAFADTIEAARSGDPSAQAALAEMMGMEQVEERIATLLPRQFWWRWRDG